MALLGLWRDWRGGDLRLLSAALILAVTAVTSVGFFTDRVNKALSAQGNSLLAADLVIEAPDRLPDEFTLKAGQLGLASSRTLTFPSVVLTDGNPQLVQVKAVDNGYPLRGELLTQQSPADPAMADTSLPESGEMWVEPRLLPLLDRSAGESVTLGEKAFRIGKLIALEPDRGGNLFQLAPRVLIHLDDVAATGLVSAASRVRHRLLLAGESRSVEQLRRWSANRLPPNAQILTIKDARPEFRAALDRGARFLALAALVSVLVTGAAIALATRRLVDRQADAMAVMRCLGASSDMLRNSLFLKLFFLLLFTSLLGALLGVLTQSGLAMLIGDWFSQDLPPPSPMPLFTGFATAGLTLAGFALPALIRLPKVPPLRVLRRDLGPGTPAPWLLGAAVFGVLALLLAWQAGDPKLAGTVLGAVVGVVTMLGLAAFGLVKLAEKLQSHVAGISRFGLASLSRHGVTTLLQMGGFGLGIMAILLLTVVRVDLLAAWEQTLPKQAPNRFLINILPEQVPEIERFLETQSVESSGLHPMIRGRLTTINGNPVIPENYTEPRARRLASREFNLSWGLQPQADNRITAGRWWTQDNPPDQFSVERGIARSLGIKLGDRLTYWIAGSEVTAPVSNLRTVQWDSFNVNFFVIGTPGLLKNEPTTFITSFYLPGEREAVTVELIKRFPNVTLLDVSALMQQVRMVMDKGSAALEYVFAFTLAAGILVLFAGIQAGAESRQREAAILRTLGASRKQLLGAAAVEFAALGLLSGLLAAFGASVAGWLLASQVFGLDLAIKPWLWLLGAGAGTLGIGLTGLLATWPLITRPPLATLRKAA